MSAVLEPPKAIKPAPPESKVDIEGRLVRVYREMTSAVEEFTPDMATAILEKQTDNRPLSQRKIDDYQRHMEEGRWMLNGETIIFDWFDRLVDGQHRLWACFNSGKKFKTMVVRGADPASFVTIDTGKPRSSVDLLSIRGEGNAVVVSGALRMIWRWELYERYKPILFARKSIRKTSEVDESPIGKRWGTTMTASPREIEEVLSRHPNIRKWVKKAVSQKTVPPTALAFVCYWLDSIGVKDEQIELFIFSVAEGASMPTNDPLFRCHKRFREVKMGRRSGRRAIEAIEAVALLVKSWNHSVMGNKIEQLMWRGEEDMPEPIK